MSQISDAGLKELSKAYLAFCNIALDGSDTAYNTAQTGPQIELSGDGYDRKQATTSHSTSTGTVTISTQFTFTGSKQVRSICFLNANNVMLTRYVPISGTFPDYFHNGGNLIVEGTCTLSRPPA